MALATVHNQQQQSGWFRQNIRSNNNINPSSSSSESGEQSPNILKTEIFNPSRCILIPEPTADELDQFRQWAEQQNKEYLSETEESCRMNNVINKLRDIHAHNQRFDEGKETFRRELNHLSDLTRKELKKTLLMTEMQENVLPQGNIPNLKDFPQPRSSVDYRTENLVSPVGNQGNCGCCWAWASAAVIESQLRKCKLSQVSVSAQNMLDCVSPAYNGCNGGNP